MSLFARDIPGLMSINSALFYSPNICLANFIMDVRFALPESLISLNIRFLKIHALGHNSFCVYRKFSSIPSLSSMDVNSTTQL